MKSILALGVGLVVALAPGGTAFAAPAEAHGTGKGKAYGNCQHSSAGGQHDPLVGGAGKGNGGHVTAAKTGPSCQLQDTSGVDQLDRDGDGVLDGDANVQLTAAAS